MSKPDPKLQPPVQSPPVVDPEEIKKKEEELYEQSRKNGPAPGGNKEVRPEEQEAG
jgi:hypothetical protein